MYHLIRFNRERWLDLERSPRQPLERVRVATGARHRAQLRPHVIESPSGPVEVADLFFEDGTAARGIPFQDFRFLDAAEERA